MRLIVDFHIHSKFSRATSKSLDLREIASWAARKGVDIVSCGDFTHPKWFSEIRRLLKEDGSGLHFMPDNDGVKFLLATEVACIYRHRDKTRRLHHLLLAPSFQAVEKINKSLSDKGCKLASDGRPILGMSSKDLLQLVLESDERCALIPAHIWTPWFSLFGSKSGYDSAEECFEDLTPHIFALETGLSSDPEMNWAWSHLDRFALVSNSDAHSGQKIGREANVFDLDSPTYDSIMDALKSKDPKKFLYTIEFFPEEGKYHYDGHRACAVSLHPAETKKAGGVCPRCRKSLTIGVLNRVDNLRDRELGFRGNFSIPYKKIVPLADILADYYQASATSIAVTRQYNSIIRKEANELAVLLDFDAETLASRMPEEVALGILRIRDGKVSVAPGYDGNYGKVSVFSQDQRRASLQKSLL